MWWLRRPALSGPLPDCNGSCGRVEDRGLPVEPVVDGSGEFSVDYHTAVLELAGGVSLRIVPVAEFDNRCLVAVPLSVWHRKVAKRVMPQGSMIKVVAVEVAVCNVAERDVILAQTMKVWMGFLDPSFVDQLSAGEDREVEHDFLLGDSLEFLPSGQSLRDAAHDHFAFVSAAEETADVAVVESGSGLEGRMDRVETSISQLTDLVRDVLEQQAPPGPSPPSRPSALRGTPKAVPAKVSKKEAAVSEKFPLLDPTVAVAALGAGVDEESLKEMQRLLSVGAPKSKKLQEPRVTVDPAFAPPRPHAKGVLSESEEEEEEAAADASGSADPVQDPVQAALLKLTRIATVLTSEKVRKSKVSKVEAALDGISSSGLTEGSGLGSGKRAATARRVLRASLQENPTEIYSLLERLMLEDLCHQTMTPGVPAPRLCARAWMEHRSKIGAYRTSAQSAWSACGILDSLIGGDVAGARARTCLLILMLDQAAVDRGSWVLASELGLEQGPPMTSLSTHIIPLPLQTGILPTVDFWTPVGQRLRWHTSARRTSTWLVEEN